MQRTKEQEDNQRTRMVKIMKNTKKKPSKYTNELIKCIGKEVTVKDIGGKDFVGICEALDFFHLNVILKTDTETVIIKNIQHIRRKRGEK
jgi:hypothetical protein